MDGLIPMHTLVTLIGHIEWSIVIIRMKIRGLKVESPEKVCVGWGNEWMSSYFIVCVYEIFKIRKKF